MLRSITNNIKMENSICRFCLKLLHGTNFKLINEVTRKMLDVLLINLDLDLSESPSICSMCSGILDEMYMFKSECLYSEDIISAYFQSNLKVDLWDILKEIYSNTGVTIAGNEVACRLCMKIPLNNGYVTLDKTGLEIYFSKRDLMKNLLTEINLGTMEVPIICQTCHILLQNYFSFVRNCMNVERNIKVYHDLQGRDDKGQVDLRCILKFGENKSFNCDSKLNEDIKQEENSLPIKVEKVESEDNNLSDNHFLESSSTELCLKHEEIDIKFEDDQISSLSSDEMVELPSISEVVRQKPKERLKQMRVNEKKASKQRSEFACNRCTYTTPYRAQFNRHNLRHKKSSKIIYKCAMCSFRAKFKRNLRRHIFWHRGNPNVTLYKCEMCTFTSNFKSSFISHVAYHKNINKLMLNPVEVEIIESSDSEVLSM